MFVDILAYHNQIDIDQLMEDHKNRMTTPPPKHFYVFKDSGSLHINNRDARWSLFESNYPDTSSKYYMLSYRVQSCEYTYDINFHGDDDRLENNRKNIAEIIAHFKILK